MFGDEFGIEGDRRRRGQFAAVVLQLRVGGDVFVVHAKSSPAMKVKQAVYRKPRALTMWALWGLISLVCHWLCQCLGPPYLMKIATVMTSSGKRIRPL